MPEATLVAVFLAGLLGGGHCAGMCGGIVGALSQQQRARLALQFAYNGGRIAGYTVAGALAGALGGLVLVQDILPLQLALYGLANVILVLVGLYLAGWSTLVTRLERLGQRLWSVISPVAAGFLPADTVARAAIVGLLWGGLPCGLTYSVLAIALVSGSALGGAALMLAFGLGTAPNLIAAGLLLTRARRWLQARTLRLVSGALVLGFGVAGLVHATRLGDQLRRGLFCLV